MRWDVAVPYLSASPTFLFALILRQSRYGKRRYSNPQCQA
jgi:hypothetical protein